MRQDCLSSNPTAANRFPRVSHLSQESKMRDSQHEAAEIHRLKTQLSPKMIVRNGHIHTPICRFHHNIARGYSMMETKSSGFQGFCERRVLIGDSTPSKRQIQSIVQIADIVRSGVPRGRASLPQLRPRNISEPGGWGVSHL